MATVSVVFDLEAANAPFPIGVYWRTDEDVIYYQRPDGLYACAPADCVAVIDVTVAG